MKKYMVTAAALMLGTSALAWAPAEKSHLAGLAATATAQWDGSATPLALSTLDKDLMKTAAAETGSTLAKGDDLGMKSLANWSDDTVQTASAESATKAADVGGVTFAEADIKSKDEVGGIQTASTVDATAATGVGGPIETATGYPACEPGPGDDRCIQLYEPGVHNSLAAWKATDEPVAMGGPHEPAPTGAKEPVSEHQRMDHGTGAGTSEGAATKTPTAVDDTVVTDTAKPVATTSPTGAIGGPVEARTGYPPCRPGRGDDRCIQLYERGVSGRRN